MVEQHLRVPSDGGVAWVESHNMTLSASPEALVMKLNTVKTPWRIRALSRIRQLYLLLLKTELLSRRAWTILPNATCDQ